MQVLNSYKQKVQSLTSNSKSLDNDIKQHQDLLERVETETTSVIKVSLYIICVISNVIIRRKRKLRKLTKFCEVNLRIIESLM